MPLGAVLDEVTWEWCKWHWHAGRRGGVILERGGQTGRSEAHYKTHRLAK